jgi:hypothetical protein
LKERKIIKRRKQIIWNWKSERFEEREVREERGEEKEYDDIQYPQSIFCVKKKKGAHIASFVESSRSDITTSFIIIFRW